MKIPILILANECRINVKKQYPLFNIEEWASWMAFLANEIYEGYI